MRITHNSLNNSPESSDRIPYIVSEEPQVLSSREVELAEIVDTYLLDNSWTLIPSTNNAPTLSEEFIRNILPMLFPSDLNTAPTREDSSIQTTNAPRQTARYHRFFEVTEANMQTTNTNTRRRSPSSSEEPGNKRICYR